MNILSVDGFISLLDQVTERTRKARTGYVKDWKICSVLRTWQMLAEHQANRTLDDLYRHVHGSYGMEGVDTDTIDDVTLMIAEAYNNG